MGYITDAIADQVAPLTKQRGRSYFVSGAVRLIEGDADHVVATVQGSRRYDVEISAGEVLVDTSCTCPFFSRDYEPCKHIWATALAAEQKGYVGIARDLADDDFDPVIEREFPSKEPGRLEKRPVGADWKYDLQKLRAAVGSRESQSRTAETSERQLVYLIDIDNSVDTQKLIVEIARRERKKDGSWGKLKTSKLYGRDIHTLQDETDRRILAILFGVRQEVTYGYSAYDYESSGAYFTLPETLWDLVLPLMCSTGHCFFQRQDAVDERIPVQWDPREPWEFVIEVTSEPHRERYNINGFLQRGETRIDVMTPELLIPGALMSYEQTVARINDHGAFDWITLLRERGPLSVPQPERDLFLEDFLRFPRRPELILPEELKFETCAPPPKPRLVVKPGEPRLWDARPRLTGELLFDYEGVIVEHGRPGDAIYNKEARQLLNRDLNAEASAAKRLSQLGLRKDRWRETSKFDLYPELLPKAVRILTQEAWRIEAEGKLYRAAANVRMEVISGVDWFELGGIAEFGDVTVSVPKLLRALKHGEDTVRLDDGTFGIVPEEWMKKYRLLAELGTMEQNRIRFTRPQAGLLDALLAAEPVKIDAAFDRIRRELQEFSGVEPAHPPPGFTGELRHYQREGLGWLLFLQRFGFGGCLADDMGLGKTVQVLALLESRRALRAKKGNDPAASLVVVPRSLVFHWKAEAVRFTPKLRILDHTGALRSKPGEHFEDYDVVLTTYGTLRRDALHFKDQTFDCCILDEAQAIKNSGTLSAKAARLLKAKHRLAMSGTPVENHLGELWSLFEFLNPGMLGSASVFGAVRQDASAATRNVLARALKPFILRRTKGEVARELPAKVEQTIFCDLKPPERKMYNELRDYYRTRLLKNNGEQPAGRVKFQALEALLRLRQAACHVGLIDKNKTGESSAKLETLFAQLEQVLEEGHKTLVFSQFTSLLALVRNRLDRDKIPYVYLDGKTRDREARVEQFQHDESTRIFLISLKAGGLGLNLHAAEYVYLLDPWWNPAVEAQAIDRAHRIGQTRQVFAYRLIARDTVEEKVLALQRTKRDLADAIITADNSLLQSLTREDLELLLS